MIPSRRIRAILDGGADGWEVVDRVRRKKRAGESVVDLTIGEHDQPTPPAFIDAMAASARGGNTGYAAMSGAPELRAAIASRAARSTGAPAGAENVVVTAGGQGALLYAMHACTDPGDPVLIIDPHYATYPGTVRAAGASVRVVAARAEDGFEPRAEALDAAASGARAILVNTPHNPTGAVYSPQTVEAIAETARKHDLWVISDEVYDTMVFEGRHVSPRGLPGMAARTVVVGSMSKSHAMTGFRLGWAVAPAELARLMGDFALNASYGLPGFIQDTALHALTHGDAEEAAIADVFRRRREVAALALEGANAVRASRSAGAMYVMLDVRAAGMTGEAFAFALLDAEGIAVMPGESFGRAAAGHVRVALTVADDRLADALRRLAAFAAACAEDRAPVAPPAAAG